MNYELSLFFNYAWTDNDNLRVSLLGTHKDMFSMLDEKSIANPATQGNYDAKTTTGRLLTIANKMACKVGIVLDVHAEVTQILRMLTVHYPEAKLPLIVTAADYWKIDIKDLRQT